MCTVNLRTQAMLAVLFVLSLLVQLVLANVEKTIFIAPQPDSAELPSLLYNEEFSGLDALSPSIPSIRRHLNASFPSETAPMGVKSWVRLLNLNPGQRYEVRICWLATQPTSFHLRTFAVSDVLDFPSLSSSLIDYSAVKLTEHSPPSRLSSASPSTSSLLLVIDAAADYFTLNETLMDHVPPVVVDIILDPYLMNIFPKSLVPTALYVALATVVAWWAFRFVQSCVSGIVNSANMETNTEKKSK
ncbi:hypothetical protein CIHG_00676 [Coccidioides immitis H538.4]|uniref:Uncharacterized protein n=1 Tax=Coccidioides immitis H538.4 TaxID=396776 RepID=A0A0J8U784_COCIT|nr:hypothetical protein CIHG_00676 [Coccidioides immitis H538.4]